MIVVRRFGEAHRVASIDRLLFGFVAGLIAVLLFHQPALALLNELGVANANVYSGAGTPPFGVPQVVSLSFWGGLWGIVFAFGAQRLPRGAAYWFYALVFGAIFPTLIAWFVVAPLKGLSLADGWELNRIATGIAINGVWGLGTALLLRVVFHLRGR